MLLNMLDVKYHYLFLEYKVDGSVMVTSIQKHNLLFCF